MLHDTAQDNDIDVDHGRIEWVSEKPFRFPVECNEAGIWNLAHLCNLMISEYRIFKCNIVAEHLEEDNVLTVSLIPLIPSL